MVSATIRPGLPFLLGAHMVDSGANIAVFSSVAERVVLCLFDEHGRETQLQLPGRDDGIWHGFVPGLAPGQRYGFRVHGPWDPSAGLRCNPAKLLLDPYARAIDGQVTFDPAAYAHDPADPTRRSTVDSAPVMPRSMLVERFVRSDRTPAIRSARLGTCPRLNTRSRSLGGRFADQIRAGSGETGTRTRV